MVLTITLTANNIVSNTDISGNNPNNLFRYQFPTTATFNNHEIALTQASIYYSWYNIDAALYNNNVFYYSWMNASGIYSTFTVTIPDGIYELAGIYNYLQYVMIQNNHYAFDTTTQQNVYYISFQVNPTFYCIDVTCYQITPTPPSNIEYNFPAPPTNFSPQVQFPNNFSKIIGFTQFTNQLSPPVEDKPFILYQSNISPQLQPNPTLVLTCGQVQNPYASPSTSIYALTAQGVIGSQIVINPPQLVWLPLAKGSYPALTFSWIGSNSAVNIRDPNQCIVLAIRNCDTDVISVGTSVKS